MGCRKFLFLALISSVAFGVGGCGYKPSSHYTRQILGKRVYATVSVFIEEPENSTIIEDALKEALKTRLNVSFSDKHNASSTINLSLKTLKFRPLQTDENGYVSIYRAEIVLRAKHTYSKNGAPKTSYYNLEGFYEFPVKPSASISLMQKFDAIKFSALKALDSLIPKLALKGA